MSSEPTYKITIEDGDPMLIVRGERRGGGIWIARITGVDAKFKYKREFVGEQHKIIPLMHSEGEVIEAGVRLCELQAGNILELSSGGKWKWQRRAMYRYQVNPERLELLQEDDVKRALGIPVQEKLPRLGRKFRTAQNGD